MSKEIKDIRVFRFRYWMAKDLLRGEYRSDGPVPIFNDAHKIVGFATVQDEGALVYLQCVMDPENPERMAMQVDAPYWLDAVLECRGLIKFEPSVVYVRALMLSSSKIEGQDPVSVNSMEMSP